MQSLMPNHSTTYVHSRSSYVHKSTREKIQGSSVVTQISIERINGEFCNFVSRENDLRDKVIDKASLRSIQYDTGFL